MYVADSQNGIRNNMFLYYGYSVCICVWSILQSHTNNKIYLESRIGLEILHFYGHCVYVCGEGRVSDKLLSVIKYLQAHNTNRASPSEVIEVRIIDHDFMLTFCHFVTHYFPHNHPASHPAQATSQFDGAFGSARVTNDAISHAKLKTRLKNQRTCFRPDKNQVYLICLQDETAGIVFLLFFIDLQEAKPLI